MSYKIVPRTEIGLPTRVTSSSGTPRPALGKGVRWLTYHYTGVSSRGYKTSDVAAEVRRIQQVFAATKPFEYNYVIGQNEDNLIYEFAGKYVAAHSAGENNDAVGVLFLNATDEPPTNTQVRKYQWLRDTLIADGTLRSGVDQRSHRFMPGAATACAGIIETRAADLVKPFVSADPLRYDPANGLWSLWPLNRSKRNLHQGDVGGDVMYLHDVLRLKAGQEVCGDVFTQRTVDAVCNVQGFFRDATTPEAGYVGPRTWEVLDWATAA